MQSLDVPAATIAATTNQQSERAPEVNIEHCVDQRVQSGIDVAKPHDEVVDEHIGGLLQRFVESEDDVDDEER